MTPPQQDDLPTSNASSVLLRLPLHKSLEELYQSTPWSVSSCESYEMDQLLYALQTPAHQSLFVLQHTFRACGDIDTVLSHSQHLWKPKSQFKGARLEALLLEQQLAQDSHSSTSTDKNEHAIPESHLNSPQSVSTKQKPQSTKKLVDAIVTLQGNSGQSKETKSNGNRLLYRLYVHLYLTLGTDLRNGAGAVAALSLSMAGIGNMYNYNLNDKEEIDLNLIHALFDTLAHIAALELQRKKTKGSRRAIDILTVVEKLAAAGCHGKYMEMIATAAAESLKGSKGYTNLPKEAIDNLHSSLWSSRPLLWLWRRGHLLHKVSQQDIASSHTLEDLPPPKFDDPTLPLVVDVGCGLGVSLIGLLASSKAGVTEHSSQSQSQLNLDWSCCNYLGGDLSPAAIRWAEGLTARWKLRGQCQFSHVSTETLLEYLLQAKVNVALILLQFPTPYRLQQEEVDKEEPSSNGCNLKLPSGPTDDSFMANPKILRRMADLITQSSKSNSNKQPAYLLVQSNCEDVALQISATLTDLGLEAVSSEVPRSLDSLASITPTTRTKAWLKDQQQIDNQPTRRAAGEKWSAEPYLPVLTETEAACIHQSPPVHRCLFRTAM